MGLIVVSELAGQCVGRGLTWVSAYGPTLICRCRFAVYCGRCEGGAGLDGETEEDECPQNYLPHWLYFPSISGFHRSRLRYRFLRDGLWGARAMSRLVRSPSHIFCDIVMV